MRLDRDAESCRRDAHAPEIVLHPRVRETADSRADILPEVRSLFGEGEAERHAEPELFMHAKRESGRKLSDEERDVEILRLSIGASCWVGVGRPVRGSVVPVWGNRVAVDTGDVLKRRAVARLDIDAADEHHPRGDASTDEARWKRPVAKTRLNLWCRGPGRATSGSPTGSSC